MHYELINVSADFFFFLHLRVKTLTCITVMVVDTPDIYSILASVEIIKDSPVEAYWNDHKIPSSK